MAEAWNAARLIPTSGINGTAERERRATSALLAVMSSVRELGRSMLSPLGAPGGRIQSYIEVPFTLGEHRHCPDGLIRTSWGNRTWTALVEVKTGTNELDAQQIQTYVDIARNEQFDAVLTISNEICAVDTGHPTGIPRSRLGRVALHHLSWTEVLTHAVVQKVHRGVSDPEQAWILGELIRYLEHPASGAMTFQDMGTCWVTCREAVASGTLRARDRAAGELAERWDQLLRFACLRLGRELGIEVQPSASRRGTIDAAARTTSLVNSLADSGRLTGSIWIPSTVGPISVTADLRAGQVLASINVDAPRQGKDQTRVNWLLRQLENAPDTLRLDTFAHRSRGVTTSKLLRSARADSASLTDTQRQDIRSFRLTLTRPMGPARGSGKGSFIKSVLCLVDEFHETTVRKLRPWTAPASRVRPEAEASVRPIPASTPAPSRDGTEPAGRENGHCGEDVGSTLAPELPSQWEHVAGAASSAGAA